MKTPNHLVYILSFLFIIAFSGCQDLDYDEATGNDIDEVFSDFARSKSFVTGIYAYLPTELNNGSMRASATDEAEHVNELNAVQKFNDGSWSSIQLIENVWPAMYAGIRSCNLFLKESQGQTFPEERFNNDYRDRIDQYKNFTFEVKFLRAFFYFELIKRYKNVPLFTTVLTPSEAVNIKETSFNEIVDFIAKECDEAAGGLQLNYTNFAVINETGRATKGAALALKARVLLYAASPLHNTSGDTALWTRAALAAKAVMDLKNGTSAAYTLPSSYASITNNINSTELIFERREGASNGFEARNFPTGVEGGNTGICPTQNLVDAYEMANSGLSIIDATNYNPQSPYNGRDPRLRTTIIANGNPFKGSNIETFTGGKNAQPIVNATKTGYYLRKYVIEITNLDAKLGAITSIEHTWILFRYGEVLLNYAEAMNEAFGPYSIGTLPAGSITAQVAVNLVRRRAQMPNFPAGMTKEAFSEKLRNERRVELAFEDHRFWDVRRWKILDKTVDIEGVKITRNPAPPFLLTFEKFSLEKRAYAEKMYFYPKPLVELLRNTNLVQNTGW